ncbi:MAG: TMEM175 family protein [Gemmatimonadota bacterium]|nr:TMEM175 family protein [Gemmatimonadota bacterium]
MGKSRLEAFSDGVIAIILTIMVLELHRPEGSQLSDLMLVLPVFASYVLSFIYVGIYWNNHHHLLHATRRVDAAVLWANLHLLFWLSLVPFTTGWMGQTHFAPTPTALYGFDLLMCGLAYSILQREIIQEQGADSIVRHAIGGDLKGKLSIVACALGIPAAYVNSRIACALYVAVALMWFVPDRRIERVLNGRTSDV